MASTLTPSNVVLARPDASAVTPVALAAGNLFVNPVFLKPNGTANFFLPSQEDSRNLIQASTNLVNWINLFTNVATGNFMDLVDADAPLGLGGWSVSVHHAYDPYSQRLLLGDGGQRRSEAVPPIITTVAGNGQVGCSFDGGPATGAKLTVPQWLSDKSGRELFLCGHELLP